jgi:Xaa-Pro aminopeptidase
MTEVLPLDSLVPRLRAALESRRILYMPTGALMYAPPGLAAPLTHEAQLSRNIASLVPDVELRDVRPFVARLRAIKDSYEIAALREAARISGVGMIVKSAD